MSSRNVKPIFVFLLMVVILTGLISAKEIIGDAKQVQQSETEEAVLNTETAISDNVDESFVPVQKDNTRAGEQINWQVISSGGQINGISTNYMLSGTAGQFAVGNGTSDNYGLSHGFWQLFEVSGGCCVVPGDANGDGGCNLGDAGFIINYIFYDGPAPTCYAEGDANADGGVNLGDAGFIINYIFYDGPAPTCGPE